MCRSAPAFTCTSLLLATAALAAGSPADDPGVATIRLESTLADKPIVYLVLDPPRRQLQIKSRGIVLDTIALEGIEVVTQQGLLGGGGPEPIKVPAVWTITTGPGDTDRELIAPTELKPYKGEDEEDTGEDGAGGKPVPTATPIPEPPPTYRAQLDNGWDLLVCQELPPRGWWSRFAASVRDGLARLRGHSVNLPPAIALAMQPDDARRLHHLMRTGTPILVAWNQ